MNFSSCWPFLQMTGRKGRVVSNDDGTISYESRSELDVPVEILNLTEKQRFMDGEKVKKNWGGECSAKNVCSPSHRTTTLDVPLS